MPKTYWNPYGRGARKTSPQPAPAVVETTDAPTGDDELVCDECGFGAKSARGLAVHQRTHED